MPIARRVRFYSTPNFLPVTLVPFLPLSIVLHNLCALFSLWSLEKHSSTLFEGGYFSNGGQSKSLKNVIRYLCGILKDDAIALVDVVAPADSVLFSPIGLSNGEAYKNLYGAILNTPKGISPEELSPKPKQR